MNQVFIRGILQSSRFFCARREWCLQDSIVSIRCGECTGCIWVNKVDEPLMIHYRRLTHKGQTMHSTANVNGTSSGSWNYFPSVVYGALHYIDSFHSHFFVPPSTMLNVTFLDRRGFRTTRLRWLTQHSRFRTIVSSREGILIFFNAVPTILADHLQQQLDLHGASTLLLGRRGLRLECLSATLSGLVGSLARLHFPSSIEFQKTVDPYTQHDKWAKPVIN